MEAADRLVVSVVCVFVCVQGGVVKLKAVSVVHRLVSLTW